MSDDNGVITLSNTNDSITSSNIGELLRFLQFSTIGRNGSGNVLRVVWCLDEFVSVLFRKMPVPVLEKVARHDDDATYAGEGIFYRKGKVFRTRKAYYYPIEEFWPTKTPKPTSAQELQDRADELVSGLTRLGMGDFGRIASPVSVFEQSSLGKSVYEQLPRGYDIPDGLFGVIDYAEAADRKEWVGNYAVGHWDRVADWDISGAYSWEASRLPDLRDCEFWHSDVMGKREQGAMFGFCRGRMFVDPDNPMQHCSPVMVNNGVLHGNPAGWLPLDCYSLDEIRFIEGSGLGGFIMEDGYFGRVQSNVRPRYPLKDIMEWFYSMRVVSPVCANICKAMGNQLVGKLLEVLHWRFDSHGDPLLGELYNPVYHSLITCGTRVKVAKWLYYNDVSKDELVCVQTDGCRILKDIEPLKRNGMGSWRLNGWFPTLVASPNIILAGDKKPQHYTHDQIVTEIEAHPVQNYYGTFSPQHITLEQAIEIGDISKVGEVAELPAHLDLPAVERQQNRVFKRFPKNGGQLLNNSYGSEPIILEV